MSPAGVRLRGRLALADGGGSDPWLRLVDGELVLEAAHRRLTALVGEPRYRLGKVRDELELRGVELTIPSGKADEVRRLIAFGRLGGEALEPLAGPFVTPASEVERAFLASWLENGELLLAWLPTATERAVASALGPEQEVETRVVWTDRRAALVGLHPLGDRAVWSIASTPERRVGPRGDRWRAGELTWRTPRKDGARLRVIAPHLLAPAAERIRLVVDDSRPAATPAERRAVLCLLQRLAASDPVAELERRLLEGGGLASIAEIAERLGSELVPLVDVWGFSDERLDALQEALRAADPASSAAIALHRLRRGRAMVRRLPLEERVSIDLAFAVHLAEAGQRADALRVLRERRERLAPLELSDLLPPEAPDATSLDRRARAELLEAQVRLGLEAGEGLAGLARMRPLVSEAQLRYAEGAEAPRATRAAALLAPGALVEPAEAEGRAEPLADEELTLVRHPLGRAPAFVAQIQSMVADIEAPSTELLRQYASALRPADHPRASAAYAQASRVLGQRAEVFVSLGRRSVGARAYDVGQGLVLLGGDHLDSRSPRYLAADAELRFAFGSELAHLRFGHRRATEDELWAGLRSKGLNAAELVLGVVPLLGRWRIGRRLGRVAGALKDGKLERAIELGKRFTADSKAPVPGESHVTEGRLVAAHRLMQLSADRAGLLLAGDPVPAVRAMLRLSPDPEAAAFDGAGELAHFLLERDTEGDLVREMLAIRVGALVSFWLSEDYAKLR